MTNTALNASNPATQTPEYLALAEASRAMVDAFCAKHTNKQCIAARRILDLLGEREVPRAEMDRVAGL